MTIDDSSSESQPSFDVEGSKDSRRGIMGKNAVGKRYLKKQECEYCLGVGYNKYNYENSCKECSGSGWVIDVDQEPIICPSCNGYKVICLEEKRSCENCSGSGYFPLIMQDFECFVECEKCHGDKTVICDCAKNGKSVYPCENCDGGSWDCESCDGTGDAEMNCEECGGSGNVGPCDCSLCGGSGDCRVCKGSGIDRSLTEVIWYRDWVESPLCLELSKYYGENFVNDLGNDEKIVMPDGRLLHPRKCSSCFGVGCSICNNRKNIGVVIETQCGSCLGAGRCKRCAGSGEEFKECPECEGSGLAVGCSDCDGEGRVYCGDCNGSGYSMCEKCYGDDENAGVITCPVCLGSGTQTMIVSERCV